MKRSPRRREKSIAVAAREAFWILPADQPAVEIAKALARKIDEGIYAAENTGGLFPTAPLAGQYDGLAYDAQVLIQFLHSLGLTPRGRNDLGVEEPDTEHDELAEILNLAQ
jgi:altronate dehydratase